MDMDSRLDLIFMIIPYSFASNDRDMKPLSCFGNFLMLQFLILC